MLPRSPFDEPTNAKTPSRSRNVITTSRLRSSFTSVMTLDSTNHSASSGSVAAKIDAASCGPTVDTRFVSCTNERLRSSRRDSSSLLKPTQSTKIGASSVTSFTCSSDAHSKHFQAMHVGHCFLTCSPNTNRIQTLSRDPVEHFLVLTHMDVVVTTCSSSTVSPTSKAHTTLGA